MCGMLRQITTFSGSLGVVSPVADEPPIAACGMPARGSGVRGRESVPRLLPLVFRRAHPGAPHRPRVAQLAPERQRSARPGDHQQESRQEDGGRDPPARKISNWPARSVLSRIVTDVAEVAVPSAKNTTTAPAAAAIKSSPRNIIDLTPSIAGFARTDGELPEIR